MFLWSEGQGARLLTNGRRIPTSIILLTKPFAPANSRRDNSTGAQPAQAVLRPPVEHVGVVP
jgi:hypothetical protein